MQLKKKLTVARNTLVVSAMTAAMLVAAAPAFAHDNASAKTSVHLGAGLNGNGLLKQIAKEFKKEVKALKKEEKHDDRDSRFGNSASGTLETRATNSASATAAISCRTDATHAHSASIKTAADARDAELKVARNAFLAATQTARDKYRIDFSASATATASASGTVQVSAALQLRKDARTHYKDAVKVAERAFNDAKRKLMGDYRAAIQGANTVLKNARLACRPPKTQ